MTLTPRQVGRLRPLFDGLLQRRDLKRRVADDPVQLVRRYHRRADAEVVGLLAASLAYGRAPVFLEKLRGVLAVAGQSPAAYAVSLTPERAARDLGSFVYRFHLGADVAALLMATGRLLDRHGTLEAVFLGAGASGEARRSSTESMKNADAWPSLLRSFSQQLRTAVPMESLARAMGAPRALHHLLPSGAGGVWKRLNMYLRWMARPADGVDLGLWTRVGPAPLHVPLDTHTHRLSLLLGLTNRRASNWRTVVEVTQSLRQLDSDDPVKYDFFLCHFGMSGACPTRPAANICRTCVFRTVCAVGSGSRRRRR